MKLLFCRECSDLFRLFFEERFCKCGKTSGYYKEDGLNAVFKGETAIPLALSNHDFINALPFYENSKGQKWGKRFDAWVCPIDAPTFVRRD